MSATCEANVVDARIERVPGLITPIPRDLMLSDQGIVFRYFAHTMSIHIHMRGILEGSQKGEARMLRPSKSVQRILITLMFLGAIGEGTQAQSPAQPPTALVALDQGQEQDSPFTPHGQRIINVPQTSIRLFLWEECSAGNRTVPLCGISLDGSSLDRVTVVTYEIGLRYARFDPLVGCPSVSPALTAESDGRLYIVQFLSQPLDVYREQIAALGGIVRHYIAQWAYLVEMDADAAARVATLPYVRWTGSYHPAYRLEELLVDELEQCRRPMPSRRYNIQVTAVPKKSIVAERIAALGGEIERADAGKLLVSATLTPEQLLEVVHLSEVLFVDRWSSLDEDMDIAREISGANYIETVAGYAGSGVRGEVFDSGFNLDHVDFQSRPLILHGPVGAATHGAATSGICFGDGTGQPQARGLLPAGQGIVADFHYTDMTGPNRYTHTGELLQDPYFAVFQSVSVGSNRTLQYNTISADTDAALFDFDIVLCQAQGNSGDPTSRPEAWAKNIISVGGVYHHNTLDRGDDGWGYGASTGPAADGRIKPTLIHFYDDIWTTFCCEPDAYTTAFGGASGSTPIVCGYVGLLFQMWADGLFGNEIDPGATVFENRCHMTTAKALLVSTAWQYEFSGPLHDLTRMNQGWGMPDVQSLYDLRERIYFVDESDVLEPFAVSEHVLQVPEGEPALKVTMTYADPPGNPAVQSQHRINDLTLRVVSPTGEIYFGNHGLLEGVWSLPDGAPDTKNTVECVFVENPQPGLWTVAVQADEIVQDSHVETAKLDADYALIVSGVFPDFQSIKHGTGPIGPGLDLLVARPHPFTGEVRLTFTTAAAGRARMTIHDVTGRQLRSLLDTELPAGTHAQVWRGQDNGGQRLPPGFYFVRLEAGEDRMSRKLLLMR